MGILNVDSRSISYTMGFAFKKAKYKKYISYLLPITCVILYYSQDKWYFGDGGGGVNWRIGRPLAHIGNAHQARSLKEYQTFALQLVNRDRVATPLEYRVLNGLPVLVESPLLSQSAQGHAEDMMKRRYYNHDTPEGKTPTDRFHQIGGRGGVGENIAYYGIVYHNSLNFGLLEKFQRSWMYSDGHRGNLLNRNYRYFGYGIAINPLTREVYAVQNFY